MTEKPFKVREYNPARPNEAYVDFRNGYIEIGGSRSQREMLAELIVKLLNEANPFKK